MEQSLSENSRELEVVERELQELEVNYQHYLKQYFSPVGGWYNQVVMIQVQSF